MLPAQQEHKRGRWVYGRQPPVLDLLGLAAAAGLWVHDPGTRIWVLLPAFAVGLQMR